MLDEQARNATSGFARMEPAVVERVVTAVAATSRTARGTRVTARLRELDELDVGMRLVVSRA